MVPTPLNRAGRAPRPMDYSLLVVLVGLLLAACVRHTAGSGSLKGLPDRAGAPLETQAFKVPLPAPTHNQTPSLRAQATATPTLPAATASLAATPTVAVTAAVAPEATPTAEEGVRVPILLYHRIRDDGNTRYILPVADFRAQMKYLSEAGYETISISRPAEAIRNGSPLPGKPVVLTFDDGFLDVYENAFPILKEYGFQGVAYIITGTLGSEKSYGYMQAEELQALVDAGWEMGSHSISHSDLKTTSLGMRNEIEKSKADLEALLHTPIRSFSYPYGIANDWIEERVKEYGYASAVGLGIFITHPPATLYYLSRREVYRGTSLAGFKALLEEEAP